MGEKCAEILFIIRNKSFPIFCFVCKKDFSRIKYFKAHYLSHHVSEESSISKTVPENFTFTVSNQNSCVEKKKLEHLKSPNIIQKYKKDILVNNNEKLIKQFICENPKCDSSFFSTKQLDQHKLTYHPNDSERPFKCTYCAKGFLCFGSLNAHVETVHLKTRIRYSCMYCTKSFNVLQRKIIHEATHNGLKAYKCIYCEKRFCKKQQMQLHIRRNHLKEKRYKCSFCEKGFFDAGEKRKHERVHTGDKPFVCVICSESFTVGQKLNNHMISKHSENPAYKCDECEKQFFIKDNFKRHKLIHQGEKNLCAKFVLKPFIGTENYKFIFKFTIIDKYNKIVIRMKKCLLILMNTVLT